MKQGTIFLMKDPRWRGDVHQKQFKNQERVTKLQQKQEYGPHWKVSTGADDDLQLSMLKEMLT